MNKSILRLIALGLVVAFASLPLYAQTSTSASNESDKTVATVQTDGGVIMISEGGEFQTASPDQRVQAKARLMVSEGSSATVVYNDGCNQKYTKPGVYEISSTCVLPIALGSGGVGLSAGLIAAAAVVGGGLIATAIADNHGSDSRPPVSR